jgi:HEAT repeat protein
MTRDPLMNAGTGIESILEKLTADQELDSSILQEKLDLMARVAVDHLYDDACGNIMSHKASAIVGLAAHKDGRCRSLILTFLKNPNLNLKRSALLAAKILNDITLGPAIAELLKDRLAIIRMQAMDCLKAMKSINLESYLEPLSYDPVWYVREKLARTLGERKTGEVILHLLEHDKKTAVRRAAESALLHS